MRTFVVSLMVVVLITNSVQPAAAAPKLPCKDDAFNNLVYSEDPNILIVMADRSVMSAPDLLAWIRYQMQMNGDSGVAVAFFVFTIGEGNIGQIIELFNLPIGMSVDAVQELFLKSGAKQIGISNEDFQLSPKDLDPCPPPPMTPKQAGATNFTVAKRQPYRRLPLAVFETQIKILGQETASTTLFIATTPEKNVFMQFWEALPLAAAILAITAVLFFLCTIMFHKKKGNGQVFA